MIFSRPSLVGIALVVALTSACAQHGAVPGVPVPSAGAARVLPPDTSPLAGAVVVADYNLATVSYLAPRTGKLLYKLSGTSTKLSYPGAVAVDSHRNTYVLGHYDDAHNNEIFEILIFDAHAPLQAHPQPLRIIKGSNTGLSAGYLAVDGAGNIYATHQSPANAVEVFAAGAHGNVAPVRVITGASTQLAQTQGVAISGDGKIHVAAYGTVLTFGRSANGDVAPLATLNLASGVSPTGVSFDIHGHLIVADYNGAVYGFSPSATGTAAPIWTLAGHRTTLSDVNSAVADKAGYIYATLVQASSQQVGIFPPGGGNVAPNKRLSFSTFVTQIAAMP